MALGFRIFGVRPEVTRAGRKDEQEVLGSNGTLETVRMSRSPDIFFAAGKLPVLGMLRTVGETGIPVCFKHIMAWESDELLERSCGGCRQGGGLVPVSAKCTSSDVVTVYVSCACIWSSALTFECETDVSTASLVPSASSQNVLNHPGTEGLCGEASAGRCTLRLAKLGQYLATEPTLLALSLLTCGSPSSPCPPPECCRSYTF